MRDASNLWSPSILDLSAEHYGAWRTWKARWEDYLVVTELRYAFTKEIGKTYDSLSLSEEDRKDI